MPTKKQKREEKINKQIDKVRDSLVENHFINMGTYKIGFRVMVGAKYRIIHQDIRDLTA